MSHILTFNDSVSLTLLMGEPKMCYLINWLLANIFETTSFVVSSVVWTHFPYCLDSSI